MLPFPMDISCGVKHPSVEQYFILSPSFLNIFLFNKYLNNVCPMKSTFCLSKGFTLNCFHNTHMHTDTNKHTQHTHKLIKQ